MIRILIADDQELVHTGFRVVLDAEPDLEVVGEAADGVAALDAAETLRPDVVLMDIRMPNLDGIEATRRIAKGDRSPRVLILTTFDLDEYVYEALRAGASGFLLKDAGADELLHAVRVVAAGEALLAPSITRRLIEDYARRPPAREQPAALELEISDNGAGTSAAMNGSGHGLIGMRERVALYGGVLETGAADSGGYHVRARLPLAGGAR